MQLDDTDCRRRPSSESSGFFPSSWSSRVFVGSHDQVQLGTPGDAPPSRGRSSTPIPASDERSIPLPPLTQRPSLTRHPGATLTPSLSGTPSCSSEAQPHQWTLFGQLMDSERPPNHSLPKHRTNVPTTSQPCFGRPVSARGSANYDSDDFSSIVSFKPSTPVPLPWWKNLFPPLSVTYRNVVKCSIAYFVASLFTFSPYLSTFIRDVTSDGPGNSVPSPSGHMVATIAVYFNPAKTWGAMLEADLFCFFGLLYSAIICLVSMSMFWWLELKPGWEWLGDVIAIAWIGLSMSALAWMKVWMAHPSFNTACSMTAILIFVVLVREGGWETLVEVSAIILCGSIISNLVCFLIWPQSAISNLQLNMTNTLDSFSTLLPMLTKFFLLENDNQYQDREKVQRAIENHQNSFTTLQKNLNEAKSEWLLTHSGENATGSPYQTDLSGRRSYEDVVGCLNRLAQHLNGLRSGTRLQQNLARAGLSDDTGKGKNTNGVGPEDNCTLNSAAAMFREIVDELGPPLNALCSASTVTLDRLREVCLESRTKFRGLDAIQPHEFSELVEGIEAALIRFESTSNHAVLRLYRRSDIHPPESSSSNRGNQLDDIQNSILAEGDSEQIFLVYFFIFTLQEFAKELISLVDAIERVYCYEQSMLRRDFWWIRLLAKVQRISAYFTSLRRGAKERRGGLGLRRSLSTYMVPPHRVTHPSFPKVRPHAPNTIQTPPRDKLDFVGKINQTLWIVGKRLKERDTKYAIKAGMATAILATPAFIDATRPIFVAYWGDWALISFFIVISPTIGATNYLSLHRLLGTLFGAIVAVGLYTLVPEDAIILSLCGFLFSLPCSYFAVAKPQYLSASRFVILTYNLTCLYCYNLRQKDVSVIDIGLHRALAVTGGILWAGLVSRFWWPAEARRELGISLSEFCLNLGWLYTRLVASNSYAPEHHRDHDLTTSAAADESGRHNESARLTNPIHEFMAMELHLQIKLIELQNLLAQAQHEPRLKGPFPFDLYRRILISLQTILDKLHSMRCVTTREEWHTSVRQDFIVPVNKERREMVGNIVLSFSTIASAFRLKAPLPPYLPPAEKSRLLLVEAIRKLDVVKNRDVKASRQLLFFAYALTMKGVTMELEFLGRILQDAFGVIGQTSEEFEKLFLPLDDTQVYMEHVA